MTYRGICIAALFALTAATAAEAKDITILVANKKTDAYKNAKAMANDDTVFAERKLHKALSRVEDVMKTCPVCPQPRVRGLKPPPCNIKPEDFCTITVKVAHGSYKGKGGRGGFALSEIRAPETVLRVLGGYDDKFEKRAPFTTPSVLEVGGTAFAMNGKNHAFKEVAFSGFVMDIGGGNSYDAKTNSLLKGTSANVPHLKFGYLETDKLIIADNVFMNSSHGVAAPLIRAHSDNSEVIIRNNIILNNVFAWQAKSASGKKQLAKYTLEGNSFLMNWPFNPDPTTANPAALEIGDKYTAKKVVLKANLFAHNIGGAVYATYAEKVGPPTELKDNLFFQNGALFGEAEPGASAVVGKFGAFKDRKIPWNTIDVETMEDDYDWDSDGNVALDPKIQLTMVKPGFANSGSVEAKDTKLNDVRSILGLNLQGGKVAIKNYAPRTGFDAKNLPFPKEAKAKKYGASPERVTKF